MSRVVSVIKTVSSFHPGRTDRVYEDSRADDTDIDVMMIQCDKCNVWQHGPCMGVWADEEAPDGTSLPDHRESLFES